MVKKNKLARKKKLGKRKSNKEIREHILLGIMALFVVVSIIFMSEIPDTFLTGFATTHLGDDSGITAKESALHILGFLSVILLGVYLVLLYRDRNVY